MTDLDQALSHVHGAMHRAKIDHLPGLSLIRRAYALLQAAQQKVGDAAQAQGRKE